MARAGDPLARHGADARRAERPATTNGLRDYDVQVLVHGAWTTVASVRGNTLRTITSGFPPVTTSAVRLLITDSNDDGYSRVVELEGFSA